MQLTFKRRAVASKAPETLDQLRRGQQGVIDRLDVPEDVAQRLMELGFMPGAPVIAGCRAPGGDPRIFRIDGSEVALRSETARCMRLRTGSAADL